MRILMKYLAFPNDGQKFKVGGKLRIYVSQVDNSGLLSVFLMDTICTLPVILIFCPFLR